MIIDDENLDAARRGARRDFTRRAIMLDGRARAANDSLEFSFRVDNRLGAQFQPDDRTVFAQTAVDDLRCNSAKILLPRSFDKIEIVGMDSDSKIRCLDFFRSVAAELVIRRRKHRSFTCRTDNEIELLRRIGDEAR